MGGSWGHPWKGKKRTKYSFYTEVIAQKVFEEDTIDTIRQKLILDYVKKGTSTRDYALGYGNYGAAQLFEYFNKGKYDYLDYLPEAFFRSEGVPLNLITPIIIELEGGKNIYVTDSNYIIPIENDWIDYQLQKLYNYNLVKKILNHNGQYLLLDDWEYDGVNNEYKVYFIIPSKIDVTVYEIIYTEYTILDDTHANKKVTTIIQTVKISGDIEIEKTEEIISVVDTIISIEEIPTEPEEDDDEGNVDTSTTILEEYTTENSDQKLTLIVPSYSEDILQYVVRYTVLSTGKIGLWIYDPSTKIYPQLDTEVSSTYKFDIYPVVMVRNDLFSVDEYDLEYKVESGERFYRPPTITKKRFEDTEEILSSIGIDLDQVLEAIMENPDAKYLQDCFINIGVSPSDDHPVVSQALYRMFDYVYKIMPITEFIKDIDFKYEAYFEQEPYNAVLRWIPQEPEIKDEDIGGIGTYKHSFGEATLTKFDRRIASYQATTIKKYGEFGKPSTIYYEVEERVWLEIYSWSIQQERGIGTKNYYGVVFVDENGRKAVNIPSFKRYFNDDGNERLVLEGGNGYPVVDYYTKYYIDEVLPDNKTVKIYSETPAIVKNLICKYQFSHTQTKTLFLGSLESEQEITRGGFSGWVKADIDNKNLVIPLPVTVVEDMSYMNRVSLISCSVYITFYAANLQKITYYSGGGWFGKFLQVLAIVIMIVVTIVFPPSGPLAMSLAAALNVTVAVAGLLINLMIGLALQIVLKIIAKTTNNPALRAALSVAAVVVAIWVGNGFEFGSMNLGFNLKTADVLVQLTTTTLDSYMGAYLGNKMEGIQAQYAKLSNQVQSFSTKYESINEQYATLVKQFSAGITADYMVQLTSEATIGNHPSRSFSPSLLRSMTIDTYRNFDLLYINDVEIFFNSRYQLGVIN